MGSAEGALKGAAGGAAAGAVLGPWGAAAGGVIGGALGYFGSGDEEKYRPDISLQHSGYATNQLGQIAGNAQYRQAPQAYAAQLGPAYQLDRGDINQSRGGLMGVANQLGGIASGQQQGAGELAVNRQIGQATAAQMAAAHGVRGSNAALAYRNAARNTADIGLAGAGQAAQAQMADQQGALGQLGQVYGGMYGQDANVAAQNAQLGQQVMLQQAAMGQQTALANLQAQLAQTGMNDQQQMQALGQMLGWDQAKVNAELAKAGLAPTPGLGTGLLQAGSQIGAAYAGGGFGRSAPATPAGSGLTQPNAAGGQLINPYA